MTHNKVIKIDLFNIKRLKELKEILENNSIINIKNELTFFDIIVIEYEDKKIVLNAEYNSKIKLIRNRYYRQLLNYIHQYKKLTIPRCNEWGELLNKDFKKYIDIEKYKEGLKIALINYIGLYNFDNIFELTKKEMISLEKYLPINFQNNPNNTIYNKKDINYISRLFGVYCHNNEELFKALKSKIIVEELEEKTKIQKEKMLEEIKKCKRFILICPELIREFCYERFSIFKEYDIMDKFEFYVIMFNKVLRHEIGHAVFDYINDDENERRANYFASLTFDGTFDDIIKKFTDMQKGEYENPKLITKDSIDTIKKDVYRI